MKQSLTAADVVAGHDLTGKVALVTGGHSGIGLETTKALAQAGATVVVGARSLDKAKANLSKVHKVEIEEIDLESPESVEQFARKVAAAHPQLHLLINNAGVMRPPQFTRDQRGYEWQFGVNHLGHFQLTGLLWPALKAANGARVVALSSIGHRYAPVSFDDINFDRHPYDKATAYGQSKTANALFAVELDRIGAPHGVRAFSAHPGGVLTDLIRYMSDEELATWGIKRVGDRLETAPGAFKTPAEGAATSLWCALNPELNGHGGAYCEDCHLAPLVPDDPAILYGVREYAIDPANAKKLWALSEQVTGVRYA